MSPLRTNKSYSLSLTSLLFVIISLVKSCEAQSDTSIAFISIPTLIVVFFVCALCWLSYAIKMMRDAVPSDTDQTARAPSVRRSNLPIFAITPYAGYRRAYLLPNHHPPRAPRSPAVPSTTSSRKVPDSRARPSTRTNAPRGIDVDPTKLTVHDPYDEMFVMEATLHQAEAPPGYEEAIRMPTDSNSDQLEEVLESKC